MYDQILFKIQVMTQDDKNLLLERYARGRESSLTNDYILIGPAQICEKLGLTENEWKVIFDYLVFQHGLLYKCVLKSNDFFLEAYIKHGAGHIRDILDVKSVKYELVWESVFDYLAVAQEGLTYHVLQHRDRYVNEFQARGGTFIRKNLGIWNEKYDKQWEQIVELLLHAACEEFFSDQDFEHSLRSFSHIVNAGRTHRPVWQMELIKK